MDFFVNTSHDPAFNLALEELLAAEYENEFFMLWRNGPSIIVGRNQNTAAEIDAAAVRELGIPVVRRITGGGAVYHDLGNINYTIARDGRKLESGSFAECARVVVTVLNRLGIPAEFSGRNDILSSGRKISGSAKSVLRDRTLFHGTMLFNVDLSVLGRVLKPEEGKIRSKGVRSVQSRVMNLSELFPGMPVDEFHRRFESALRAELSAAETRPPPEEFCRRAEILADERYRTWEWNFGSVYPYDFSRKRRFAGGTVELAAKVAENRIESLRFYGDFFGDAPVSGLEQLLAGVPFRREELAKRLAGVRVERYLRGVSEEELLSLFE